MMIRRLAILSLIALVAMPLCLAAVPHDEPAPVVPQKKTSRSKKPQLTEEEMRLKERIDEMTSLTQKIVIVDSIVVGKAHFLTAIPLPDEGGSICMATGLFANVQGDSTYAHINQLGDLCHYADNVEGGLQLLGAEKIGGKWNPPYALKGLEEFKGEPQPNCPFMMADGITMYFAAKGEESIGGYDIFMTRYDARTGKFFKPENIGMPFNSTANDYMLVIDEFDNIGWFASDRRQATDQVCIYTFIPSDIRQTYADDGLSDEQMASMAAIASIADTWGDGTERDKALARIDELKKRMAGRQTVESEIDFVVNDQTTYKFLKDFKTEENRARYRQLMQIMADKEQLDGTIERKRAYYIKAGKQLKDELGAELLENERKSEEMELQIAQLTKEIRNKENE